MYLNSNKISSKQRGAVWVEFLVGSSAVLVSLFLLIPMLAKFSDIKQKTEQVAQYASWERTVWNGDVAIKSKEKIMNESQHRVLADGDGLIFSGGSASIDSFHYFTNQINSPSQYETLLIPDGSGSDQFISMTESNSDQPGLGKFKTANSMVSIQTDVKKVINYGGYYKNQAGIKIKQPSWLDAFTDNEMKLSTGKSILVDGWDTGGASRNKKDINNLQSNITKPIKDIFMGFVSGLNGIDAPLSSIGINIFSDIAELDFDHVNTDKIYNPHEGDQNKDRLGVY